MMSHLIQPTFFPAIVQTLYLNCLIKLPNTYKDKYIYISPRTLISLSQEYHNLKENDSGLSKN